LLSTPPTPRLSLWAVISCPLHPQHNSAGGAVLDFLGTLDFLEHINATIFSFKSLRVQEGGRRTLQKGLGKVYRSKEQHCHISYFLFQKHV
jgi:hypothetical protein